MTPGVCGIVGGAILVLTVVLVFTSRAEGEPQAARRLGVLGSALALLFLLPLALPPGIGSPAAAGLLGAGALAALALLVPLGRGGGEDLGTPQPGFDERDIMFSRALLEPGTDRFEAYYGMRPQYRAADDAFRREPGLMASDASHHHPLAFPAADAAFWTIEMLRPYVEGGGPVETGASGGILGGGTAPGGPEGPGRDREAFDASEVTAFLEGWTLKMGAHSVGVTRLEDYHRYTHVGRGSGYGKAVELDHSFAIALTVEMDKEMVESAPRSPTVMESAYQYLRCGAMAVALADMIRRLGYDARAHVDGNYRVICPLVARDAGLGELGRMGLLMTPRLGPRCRIAVVTTDLPLATSPRRRNLSVIEFCRQCRKCAEACPSRALPFGDPEEVEGVWRWKVDAEACFTLWCRLGTDCARCMAVCPYSHPDNWMHNGVRWGIRNNRLFRRGAIGLDDVVYGRRPPARALPDWFKVSEAEETMGRTPPGGAT
jgi:ferredoxin